MSRIRVMLVDDQAELIERLRSDLTRRFDIVGTADSGESCLATVAGLRPDVVVLDVSMRGMSGIAAATHVKRIVPDVNIIMWSMHKDEVYVQGALKAGASAYVLKTSGIAELAAAIHAVHTGEPYSNRSGLPAAIELEP